MVIAKVSPLVCTSSSIPRKKKKKKRKKRKKKNLFVCVCLLKGLGRTCKARGEAARRSRWCWLDSARTLCCGHSDRRNVREKLKVIRSVVSRRMFVGLNFNSMAVHLEGHSGDGDGNYSICRCCVIFLFTKYI